VPADGEIRGDRGIRLRRGGVVLLDRGSVTTFVPVPDHIHMTGVPVRGERVVSLHLYGRNMDSFHVYDVAEGTRRRMECSGAAGRGTGEPRRPMTSRGSTPAPTPPSTETNSSPPARKAS